jgi:hypothetical protein
MHANLQKLMGAQQELNQAKAAQFKVMSEAKSKVGVFSMYAVQEARDLFWGSMGQGKVKKEKRSIRCSKKNFKKNPAL